VLGCSVVTVLTHARRLGLKKSPAFLLRYNCQNLLHGRSPRYVETPVAPAGPVVPDKVKYQIRENCSRKEAIERNVSHVQLAILGDRSLPRCPSQLELLGLLQGSVVPVRYFNGRVPVHRDNSTED
jgi:hypothetical protein